MPPLSRDAVRPVHDQRRGDAAFVDPVLVQAERRVREVRPGGAVALVGVLRAGHALGVVAEVHRLAVARVRPARSSACSTSSSTVTSSGMSSAQAPLSARKMTSVLSSWPVFSSAREDAADALVHAVDLRRVDLHAAQQPAPCARPRVHGGCVGSRSVSFQCSSRMPDCDQPVEPLLAQRVPALVEAALVLGDVLVVRVQRPVRRGVGDVLEERLVRRARCWCRVDVARRPGR